MLVILKRIFFVGGNRYRSIGKSAVEIPDKFKDVLPKDAVVVSEPEVPEVPVEDGPVKVPVEDGPVKVPIIGIDVPRPGTEEEKPYVNPAHALDPERAFAEAFSGVNEEAKSEVDSLRDQIKSSVK